MDFKWNEPPPGLPEAPTPEKVEHHEQDNKQVFNRMCANGLCEWSWTMSMNNASRWATIESVAGKIGCAPQTLHDWVGKTEINNGRRPGVTTDMAEKMKALEREVRELRQANEILRKASAYFAPPLGE